MQELNLWRLSTSTTGCGVPWGSAKWDLLLDMQCCCPTMTCGTGVPPWLGKSTCSDLRLPFRSFLDDFDPENPFQESEVDGKNIFTFDYDGNEVAVYGEQFVECACSGSETKYDDRDFDEEYFLDLDPVVAEGKFIRKEEHGLSPPQWRRGQPPSTCDYLQLAWLWLLVLPNSAAFAWPWCMTWCTPRQWSSDVLLCARFTSNLLSLFVVSAAIFDRRPNATRIRTVAVSVFWFLTVDVHGGADATVVSVSLGVMFVDLGSRRSCATRIRTIVVLVLFVVECRCSWRDRHYSGVSFPGVLRVHWSPHCSGVSTLPWPFGWQGAHWFERGAYAGGYARRQQKVWCAQPKGRWNCFHIFTFVLFYMSTLISCFLCYAGSQQPVSLEEFAFPRFWQVW